MANLIIYMVVFMLVCIIALWIIEQHFPSLAEWIENLLEKFDNEKEK